MRLFSFPPCVFTTLDAHLCICSSSVYLGFLLFPAPKSLIFSTGKVPALAGEQDLMRRALQTPRARGCSDPGWQGARLLTVPASTLAALDV